MRWAWIDHITEFEPERRMVAVKAVSRGEDHLYGDLAEVSTLAEYEAVMPASLMIEGMAQTAGILVSTVNRFEEKVILAKISKARFDADVRPGQLIRYDATIERVDPAGASTTGTIDAFDPKTDAWRPVGEVDLMFSHIDQNMSGLEFPEENFVLSDALRMILRDAGMAELMPS